jgi:NAD+ synthase
MSASTTSLRDGLRIDAAAAAAQIESAIRDIVFAQLRRKGAVVAISGGIDSSVVAALCARALGKDRVLGLLLPEADSSPDSRRLATLLADSLGIRTETEDITPILTAAGCYRRRDDAIRSVLPEYGDGFKCKIVLPDASDSAAYPIFSVVVQGPDGRQKRVRLSYEAYLGIVAATNFKQRTRKMLEYYYADRHQYAVSGTPNLLEYDQGFFVKNGDGAADFKPIAHLYKCQVYQLAAYLGVPEEIQNRPPTTDTYPLEQSQREFYFTLSMEDMDLCLFAKNHETPAAALAAELGVEEQRIERLYAMIESKRKAARYLLAAPIMAAAAATAGEAGANGSK